MTSKTIQLVGGRGFYREFPVARPLHDVCTATLMPLSIGRMLEAIGKYTLGIQVGMFRVDSGPQGS